MAKTDGSAIRQITFERDPRVGIGVPKWSPAGDLIAFVTIREGQIGVSVVHPDGSGLRPLVDEVRAPSWSGDGRWLYYESMARERLEKIQVEGGAPVAVRPGTEEAGRSLPAAVDETALYYLVSVQSNIFGLEQADKLIRCARPEDGPAETIASISGDRISGSPRFFDLVLSRDGQWLALPLADGGTTNVWMLPTASGPMKQVTDFGGRATEIARSLSWSADGHSIYAAIGELEADIVLFDGLIRA